MAKKILIDQMNRRVEVVLDPLRIVSLVPSQTELLYDLGLNEQVVGITKFCIHPKQWHQKKKRIGGTKNLKIKEIIDLNPDLIIGNKEENTSSDIHALSDYCPVWMSDVNSVADAIEMINEIGALTNTIEKATPLAQEVNEKFQSISRIGSNKKVLYCIWDEPTMVVGRDTYIHSVMESIGFVNCIEKSRYPAVSNFEDVKPDLIFLSSEPFPFTESHVKKYQTLFPKSKVLLVDGEMFSWYGSRMILAVDYFKSLVTTT